MMVSESLPTSPAVSVTDSLRALVVSSKVDGLFRVSLSNGTLFYERMSERPTWAEFYPLACWGKSYALTLGEFGEVEKIRALTRTDVVLSAAEGRTWGHQQLSSHEVLPGSEAWSEIVSSIQRGFERAIDSTSC
jgi:hypothetical protein